MSDSILPIPPDATAIPMTIGQILDRIYRLLKSGWRPFIGIGILPFGILFLFYAALLASMGLAGIFKHPPVQPNVDAMLLTILPVYLLFLPVMLLAYGLYYGASTYAALHADLGLPVTVAQCFRHAWSKIGRYAWLMFLRSLIIAAPFLVIGFLFAIGAALFALTSHGSPNPGLLFLLIPLGILVYFGGLVYAILMSLRLSLAFPACVHENLTAVQSIKRSGELTQGGKGRIFVVALVIYAISIAGMMILYFVFAVLGFVVALAGAGNWEHMGPVSYIALGILALFVLAFLVLYAALLMAAYSVALAILYRDQRLRKDPPPPILDTAWPTPPTPTAF